MALDSVLSSMALVEIMYSHWSIGVSNSLNIPRVYRLCKYRKSTPLLYS